MTAITKLLAQKEQLTEQLQKVSAPEEREQIETISDWVRAGAPEGSPSEIPPAPSYSSDSR